MADVTLNFTLDQARLGAVVQPILARKAASVTRRIAAQARQDVPVKTGNLGRSIQEDPIQFIGPFRVQTGVTATAKYAKFVHDGTRPHVIRPKNARFLVFETGGRTVFARKVNHPGTRARPFLRDAANIVAQNP